MKQFKVKDHEPSLLPDGEWDLIWSDEFDGDEVDLTKWDYRLCMMGKRHPAWTDKGVTVKNGCAEFRIFEEDGNVVSSQLQTGHNFMDEPVIETKFEKDSLQWPIGKLKENKFTYRYGYCECRCRLQQHEGWWSAFWLQSPMIGASLDPKMSGSEVDIMESFHPGKIAAHNVYTGGYGQDMQRIMERGIEYVDQSEFHTFGLLWTEKEYIFYVDGIEDGRIDRNVSGIPQFILISTEAKGYRKEAHRPIEDAYAAARAEDTFLVDYVRVFAKKEN